MDVVRKFYVNLVSYDAEGNGCAIVFFRGKFYDFSSCAINKYLGLEVTAMKDKPLYVDIYLLEKLIGGNWEIRRCLDYLLIN